MDEPHATQYKACIEDALRPKESRISLNQDRVSTGIEGFDGLVEGGLPRGSLVVLAGEPGTGKTIFGSQYLYHGISHHNEPGVYASLAENRDAFMLNMKRMKMDFEKYEAGLAKKEKTNTVMEIL